MAETLESLRDFIANGCSAREIDRHSALADLAALQLRLDAADILRKSWHDLCRLISLLDQETDWSGCDDGTFDEEFDPWVILRALAPEEA